MIINAGIEQVVYEGDYPDPFSLELFGQAQLELLRYVDGKIEKVELSV